MANEFVSLHTHSTYSYGDGHGQPEDFVARAVDLQHPALALSEHGNVSSHVKLEKSAVAAGIKPLFGCELYTRDTPDKHKFHMGVLAMNQSGYRDLLSLVSASWRNFYYFPTTTSGMLSKYGDNLIILSGCSGSAISCRTLGGKGIAEPGGLAAAMRIACAMRERYGDRYYLELQAFPELDHARALNQILVRVHQKTGIPLVATLDAHYPKPDDMKIHSLVHAIARGGAAGKKTVDQQEESWDYNVPMTLFGRQDVGRRLHSAGVDDRYLVSMALDNTLEIADRCSVTLPKMQPMAFPLPEGVATAEDLIWQWLRDGWKYRHMSSRLAKGTTSDDYVARLNREMELVIDKGFVNYFLIISDVVRWAKGQGIVVGPARGSAAASLVCYLLRITEIDPMVYPQMYFERFMDPNRVDLPDIDLDFDDERRDEIRRYLIGKYGADHVGNIGTFTKYRGKNALDDVARVTRVPLAEVTRLKEFVIERSSGDSRVTKTLIDTMDQFPLARQIYDRNPSLSQALELEGMLKSMGVHAAGLVVSNQPLTDVVALYTREAASKSVDGRKRKLSVLSVDKRDAEHLGIMKIDILGLKTCALIRNCLDMTGMTLDELYALPVDDERVIDAFKRCDVKGIFQFEGRTTKSVVAQLMPDTFQELIDINALSRPGPYHSGTTLDYINAKWGKWNRADTRNMWTHNDAIERICGFTKYQIIYQEQILAICREIGDFTWGVISEIRKIVSLKYGEAAFNSKHEMFMTGAERNGYDPEQANAIFRRMITAGQYAFNMAHSVSYTMLGYWAMYFKVHHPAVFYTAAMRKSTPDKWPLLMRDMMDPKYASLRGDPDVPTRVANVDINKSSVTWVADQETGLILPGFSQIPGVGAKLAVEIAYSRTIAKKLGHSWGWRDIANVKGVGPKKLEVIQQWVDNEDPFGVSTLRIKLDEVRSMLRAGHLVAGNGSMLPAPTHKSEDLPYDMGTAFNEGGITWDKEARMPVVWVGRVKDRNLRDLFEEYRTREGTELDPSTIKAPDVKLSMVLYAYDDTDEINLRVNRFKYEALKTLLMRIRLNHDIVVVDGYKTKSFGRKVEINRMWVIDPD
jgi:DNA polymerase III subunit alpha